jgi:hypothetical protein
MASDAHAGAFDQRRAAKQVGLDAGEVVEQRRAASRSWR